MVQLTPREKQMAIIGTGLLTVGLFYGLLLKPTLDRCAWLMETLPIKQQELTQLTTQGREYQRLQADLSQFQDQLHQADTSVALLPHLETLLQKRGLQQHIASMNEDPPIQDGPYEVSAVEIKIERISFRQLLDLLQDIQNNTVPVSLSTLHVTPGTSSHGRLQATLRLQSPRPATQTARQ